MPCRRHGNHWEPAFHAVAMFSSPPGVWLMVDEWCRYLLAAENTTNVPASLPRSSALLGISFLLSTKLQWTFLSITPLGAESPHCMIVDTEITWRRLSHRPTYHSFLVWSVQWLTTLVIFLPSITTFDIDKSPKERVTPPHICLPKP